MPDPSVPDKPETAYFFEENKEPPKVDNHDRLKDTIEVLAAVTKVVPVVGTVFEAVDGLSKFLLKEHEEPKLNLVKELQTALSDALDAEDFKKAKNVCKEIATEVTAQESVGFYTSTNLNMKADVDVHANWLFERSAGGTSDSLGVLIDTTLDSWKWQNKNTQALLIDLYGRFFQCYQLRCTLFANMAAAAKKQNSVADQDRYKLLFVNELKILKTAVNMRKDALHQKYSALQMTRLNSVMGIDSPHILDDVIRHWKFYFSDTYSKREWVKEIVSDDQVTEIIVETWT